jgi:multiple antibiotic resistance protein
MKNFWTCFVPLFVAMDALGVLPVYIGLTEGIDADRKKRLLIESMVTALGVALLFVVAGPSILRLVGITVSDFMVAGGILLLVLSLYDLITGDKKQRMVDPGTLGAVPIGVPLITGPAVLTTSMLLVPSYGLMTTAMAVIANMAITCLVFLFEGPVVGLLRKSGAKTLSKITSLFMASIAVMLMRKGLVDIIQTTLN